MEDWKIDGIEGMAGGLLGLITFFWDWLIYQAIEDIGFEVFFLIVIAIGIYILRGKRVVELDTSSKYGTTERALWGKNQ